MDAMDKIHVLVIEDSADTAWSVKAALEGQSTGETQWTVETAEDLAAATPSLQSGRVDVVLLDLHLARGPAGPELVKIVKGLAPEVKLVAFTGWVDEALKQQVLDAGAADYVIKPAEPTVLARTLMHAVIYRRSDENETRINALLERLGQAIDSVARTAGESPPHGPVA